MKRRVCFVSLVLCLCLLFTGCSFLHKDAECVDTSYVNVRSIYALEYDELLILKEERIPEEEIQHYSESTVKSAREIADIIAEKPQKGYAFVKYEEEKGSEMSVGRCFGISSDGKGFSWYELGINVTSCEEIYVEVEEKNDTFRITYYSVDYSKGIRLGDLYLFAKRKEADKALVKNVVEVGKQDIYIRYKT